ncbi:MAG: hypothetical protein ACREH8_21345 [Opitutaceae bacterium]
MSRKIDRALRGPSWIEVILGAVISLVLGVALGAALLVFRPVVSVKQMPKVEEIDPEAVYFVEGSRDPYKSRDAATKRKAFVEGKSISVIEDELNSLTGAASGGQKPADQAAATDQIMASGSLNFRVRDGTLQVGVPVTVNFLGLGGKVIVQTRGGFEQQGSVFVYDPGEFYVGSLPVQRLPFLAGYARDQFLDAQVMPDDIKAAWMKLAGVSIDGNVLNLKMP